MVLSNPKSNILNPFFIRVRQPHQTLVPINNNSSKTHTQSFIQSATHRLPGAAKRTINNTSIQKLSEESNAKTKTLESLGYARMMVASLSSIIRIYLQRAITLPQKINPLTTGSPFRNLTSRMTVMTRLFCVICVE